MVAYLEGLARTSEQEPASAPTPPTGRLADVVYLERLARSSEQAAAADLVPEPPAPVVAPAPRSRRPEAWLLAVVALGVYLVAGAYLRFGLDFVIGDAVARSAEAKYMLMSRDAHAAALGFYWMPIPTLSQLPLLLVLAPFGIAEFAGPASTACWGAGTVLVLMRTCADLRLARTTSVVLVAAYAFNPVVVYYAANAMGEGALFFFVALMLRGSLAYVSRAKDGALVTAAIGLAGAVMSRYEAVPLLLVVPLLLGLADLQRRSRARAVLSTAIAGLPAAWCLLLWVFYMKSIGGSYTAFRSSSEATTGAAPGRVEQVYRPAYFDDATGSVADALGWTVSWLLLFGPAVLLLPLLLVPLGRRSLGTLAVLGTVATLPAVTFYLLVRTGTTGEPRYFTSFVVLAAVAAIWTAARLQAWEGRGRRVLRLAAAPVVTGALVLGAFTGTYALTDGDRTHYNAESTVFAPPLGLDDGRVDVVSVVPGWRTFADQLDRGLPDDAEVLADTRYSFWAALLSERTDQFVMNSDRDYQQQVAPTGVQRFDYAIVPASGREGLIDAFDDAGRIVRSDEQAWERVLDVPGTAALWRRTVPVGEDGLTVIAG